MTKFIRVLTTAFTTPKTSPSGKDTGRSLQRTTSALPGFDADDTSSDDDEMLEQLNSIKHESVMETAAKETTVKNEGLRRDFRLDKTRRKHVDVAPEATLDSALHRPGLYRFRVLGVEHGHYLHPRFSRASPELLVSVIDQNDAKGRLILRESWSATSLVEKCIVHVIGTANPEGDTVIDDTHNLLVVSPDTLITCTSVADAFNCKRCAVLKTRQRDTGDVSEPMVRGILAHELIQAALVSNDLSTQFLENKMQQLVEAHVEDIVLADTTQEEMLVRLREEIAALPEWHATFFKTVPDDKCVVVTHRDNHKPTPTYCSIARVLDVEQEIWSPMFGLKGKVDVTVELSLRTGAQKRRVVAPFEIKTSTGFQRVQHRAQTTLYTLLLADRYDLLHNIDSGILFYSRSAEMIRIPVIWDEIRLLLVARNELARYYQQTRELPPMLNNQHVCARCNYSTACMLYHRAAEGGSTASTPLEIFPQLTDHLSERHLAFFNHWDDLLTKEAAVATTSVQDIWNMAGVDREEMTGLCLTHMRLADVRHPIDPTRGKTIYVFRRDETAGNDFATSLKRKEMEIHPRDPVIVSDERGHVCLARGYLDHITDTEVHLELNRPVSLATLRLAGFDELTNQAFASVLAKDQHQLTGLPTLFRIDKDEVMFSMALLRNNLVYLLAAPPMGDEQRRRLIADLEPPVFDNPRRPDLPDATHYNQDQLNAITKILSARDYALVLGMPGTGKTTTIAQIIRLIVSAGKSVLVAAHTHSAVDNILAKIMHESFGITRLGAPFRVHPDVRHLCPSPAANADELRAAYFDPPVVGTTCMGIGHWLFNKRSFDYCIVDEASQVTLPAIIGPLRFAKTFVLVGDHYQLPPVVRSSAAFDGGYDVSLFKLLCEAHPSAMVELTHQYRMNEDIMHLSNQLIYDGKLVCGSREVAQRVMPIPNKSAIASWRSPGLAPCNQWLDQALDETRRVMFLNTDNVPALELNTGERVENETEAQIVQQIVSAMQASGVNARSIGIISQYRAQLRVLQRMLRDRSGLEIMTADKAQGRDKECIIVSLVRSNDRQLVGDLLEDWRRLNVAFTRAMGKLIVVGSRRTLESASALRQFLNIFDSKGWMYDLPAGCTQLYQVSLPSSQQRSPPSKEPRVVKSTRSSESRLAQSPVLRDIANEMRASR